jgi:hypothetical protein
MTRMGTTPEKVLTADSLKRFEQLFMVITDRLHRHQQIARRPFR